MNTASALRKATDEAPALAMGEPAASAVRPPGMASAADQAHQIVVALSLPAEQHLLDDVRRAVAGLLLAGVPQPKLLESLERITGALLETARKAREDADRYYDLLEEAQSLQADTEEALAEALDKE